MRRMKIALAVTASLVAQTVRAQASQPFGPADLFALKRAEDVRISPNGRSIAYVRAQADIKRDGDRHDVMIVDIVSRRERLIASSATMPRWSPDGRTIAYVAADGKGGSQIVLKAADDAAGPDRALPGLPGSIGSLVWSPDGRRLAFTAFVAEPVVRYVPQVKQPQGATWAAAPRIIVGAPYQQDGSRSFDPGHMQLFVVATDTAAVRQVTNAATDVDSEPVWSRTGDALVYSAQPVDFLHHLYTNARLYRVDAAGGPSVAISPEGLGARSPAISPDGRFIAFVGARPTGRDYAEGDLYIMDRDGGRARKLAPDFDQEMGPPHFSADGLSILSVHGDHGVTVATRFALDGSHRIVVRGIGGDTAISVARDGSIAFPSGDFNHPADAAIATSDGRERDVTSLNATLLDNRRLATIRPLTFRSKLDGAEIGAWLVLPPLPGKAPRPLILSIHGGPYGYDDPTWSSEDQLLAAAGYAILHVNYRGSTSYGFAFADRYAILHVNYRGSTSYGFAFADRIARDYPGPAYTDLMSGVDAVVATGIADRNRLFVEGGSAGGMLAAWIVGRTSRFKAAVVVKPVIDEISDSLVTDQFAAASTAVGAMPWEQPMAYWRRSPLSLVGNVSTPTMVAVGEQDHRTPIGEAEEFFDALQLRRVPSQLVVFPDAGHASIYGTPSRLMAGITLELDWFARHGGLPAPSVIAAP